MDTLETKRPEPVWGRQPGAQDYRDDIQNSTTKHPRKWARVLEALLEGRSFNRFEAERELHDHCLHSTIATIQAKGIAIDRVEEQVPGYQGIPTRVTRYWLSESWRQPALRLLGVESDDQRRGDRAQV